MNTQLFIPKKCKVGFNLRSDCYTKKLGYVIAWDGKKWRKEPSWENWREKEGAEIRGHYDYESKCHINGGIYGEEVRPVEFANDPISGFVLNKKVGGTRYSWNPRQTYSRVFDPRGFEFEINIANLLYILEHCNSLKGKGLEGEFVYAWDGPELVLLPCSSLEFEQATNYTRLQSEKISAKSLVAGCQYKTKKEEIVTYLGRYNWYDWNNKSYRKSGKRTGKKLHIFIDDKNNFITKNNVEFLAEKISEEVSNFAELIELFQNNIHSGKIVQFEIKEVLPDLTVKHFGHKGYHIPRREFFQIQGNTIFKLIIDAEHERSFQNGEQEYSLKGFIARKDAFLNISEQTFAETAATYYSDYHSLSSYSKHGVNILTAKEILDIKMGDLYAVLENGRKIKINNIYDL